MLVLSIVFSLFMWACIMVSTASSRQGTGVAVTASLLLMNFVGMFLACVLPVVMLQAVLTLTCCGVCRWFKWSPSRFALLATVAMFASYGYVAWGAYAGVQELQQKYPLVSIEERLPQVSTNTVPVELPKPALDGLEKLEKRIDEKADNSWTRFRESQLRQVHEETFEVFAAQPGFGVSRMMRFSQYTLRGRRGGTDRKTPQPGQPSEAAWSSGTFTQLARKSSASSLNQQLAPAHLEGVFDFLNPEAYGYVRDRKNVTGFQPHEMQLVPSFPAEWNLRSVYLIGLVLHEEPVVYVSANLPSMEDLKSTQTVPLDDFEAAGLQRLRAGDDLFSHEEGNVLRAVGALRATKQCLQCHSGNNRGDLLGAFSYHVTIKSEKN